MRGPGDHAAPLSLLNGLVRHQGDAALQGLFDLSQFANEDVRLWHGDEVGHAIGLEHVDALFFITTEEQVARKQWQ